MPIVLSQSAAKHGVKTGRRANPAINGPRDRTVCFMLSEPEKDGVDRLAFCMHLTRSGILANIVAEFVAAAEGSKQSRAAAKALRTYLSECRKAVKKRGAFADKAIAEMKGKP
jgi:aminopeptidase C